GAEPMETVRRALGAAQSGAAGALLVRGEAGIGRTAFLAGAAQLATRLGFQVARSRCYPLAHDEWLATARQLTEDLRPAGPPGAPSGTAAAAAA
ncbi:hypothetical protein, partial [Kitasatospora nipponensis]|uniref:hypothetical protein n=1 Tax=Kitasatospora nipponensis TaxID=258049 RepID=UPI0031D2B0F7